MFLEQDWTGFKLCQWNLIQQEDPVFFRYQGGKYCLCTEFGTREDIAYPLKPTSLSNKVTSRKSKKLWTKGPEWNNVAYEEKKYHYFTHPAQDATNSYPYLNLIERIGAWEIRRPIPGASKRKKNKLKESKLGKLHKLN